MLNRERKNVLLKFIFRGTKWTLQLSGTWEKSARGFWMLSELLNFYKQSIRVHYSARFEQRSGIVFSCYSTLVNELGKFTKTIVREYFSSEFFATLMSSSWSGWCCRLEVHTWDVMVSSRWQLWFFSKIPSISSFVRFCGGDAEFGD